MADKPKELSKRRVECVASSVLFAGGLRAAPVNTSRLSGRTASASDSGPLPSTNFSEFRVGRLRLALCYAGRSLLPPGFPRRALASEASRSGVSFSGAALRSCSIRLLAQFQILLVIIMMGGTSKEPNSAAHAIIR